MIWSECIASTTIAAKKVHSLNFILEKKMKRYLGLILASTVLFASIEAYAATKHSSKTTETLVYQVQGFNQDMGTALIKIDRKRGKVSKLMGEFKSEGTLQKFYPMENRQVTYVDHRGNPKKTFQKRTERSVTENFNIKYKRQKVQVFYERGGKKSNRVRKSPNAVQDILSALYSVAEWKAKDGSSMEMTMFSGKQFYKVQVTAAGLEQIWTPLRGVEDARRVNVIIERISGSRKGEKSKITLWVDSKSSGQLLKAAHHFKYVGDVVVVLKERSVEVNSRKRLAKAKSVKEKLKVRRKK